MGRPLKTGLDYFPLDVNLDDDIELIEAECGIEGFAIIVKLWQKIYSNSYYINWEDDNALLFSRKINSGLNLVNSVVNCCLRRNLFNKLLNKKYKILTSEGIQKRYVRACSDSKRKNIIFKKEYCLLTPEFTELITEFTGLTQEESTQTKVKESKVEETKEKYYDVFDFYLTLNLKKHKKFTESMKDAIKKFIRKTSCNFDECKKALELHCKIVERTKQNEFKVHCRPFQEFFGQKVHGGTQLIGEQYIEGGKYYDYFSGSNINNTTYETHEETEARLIKEANELKAKGLKF